MKLMYSRTPGHARSTVVVAFVAFHRLYTMTTSTCPLSAPILAVVQVVLVRIPAGRFCSLPVRVLDPLHGVEVAARVKARVGASRRHSVAELAVGALRVEELLDVSAEERARVEILWAHR